jgi:hypothetical protein
MLLAGTGGGIGRGVGHPGGVGDTDLLLEPSSRVVPVVAVFFPPLRLGAHVVGYRLGIGLELETSSRITQPQPQLQGNGSPDQASTSVIRCLVCMYAY